MTAARKSMLSLLMLQSLLTLAPAQRQLAPAAISGLLPKANLTRSEIVGMLTEMKFFVSSLGPEEFREFSAIVFSMREQLFDLFNMAFGMAMSDYNVLCHFCVYPNLIHGHNYPVVQELATTLLEFVIQSLRGGDTKHFLFEYVRLYMELGQPYATYSNLLRHSGDRTESTLLSFARDRLPEVAVPQDCRKTLLVQLSDPRLLLRPRCLQETLEIRHDSMTSLLQFQLLAHVSNRGEFDSYNTTHRIVEFIELIIFGHFDALKTPNRMWINPEFEPSLPGKLSSVANLIRYGYPMLLLVGTVSNIVALLFSLVTLSESISCMYFLALSVLDLLCLWSNLVPILLSLYFDVFAQEYSQATCKLLPFLEIYFAGCVAWLVAALTLTKVTSLVRPFWQPLYSRRAHRILICALLVTVAAACCPPLLSRYRLVVLKSDFFIQCWRHDSPVLSYGLEKMWLALVFPVTPLVLVLVGNFVLIMLRSRHLRQQAASAGCRVDDKSFGSLIFVSCVFLTFTAPNTVVQLIEAFRSQNISHYDVSDELNNGNGTLFNYWAYVTHFVMLLHNAVNIFTYGMSAPYLRQAFRMRLARLATPFALASAARPDPCGSVLSVRSSASTASSSN